MHLQDFGFPRVRVPATKTNDFAQFGKRFKWKKINYKTLLPKHAHVVAYLVAKTNNYQNQQFMMHAAAHAREFDVRYTQTEFTKQIRADSSSKSRLSKDDRNASTEVQRVIVCHVKVKVESKKDKKPCKQFRKQGHQKSFLVTKVRKGAKNNNFSDSHSDNSVSEDGEIMESSESEQCESNSDDHMVQAKSDLAIEYKPDGLVKAGLLHVMQPPPS